MYKHMVALVVCVTLLVYSPSVNACGVCGCNMSNFNPELLMSNGAHSIGVLNQTRWYTARLHAHGPDTKQGEYDNYSQIQSLSEVRGAWYATQRLSFIASLPVSHKLLAKESLTQEAHTGLGDATLMAQYIAIRDGKRLAAKGFEQRLIGGAGIKLPTGKFNELGAEGAERELTPHLQNGSGSVDFLMLVGYFIKFKKVAIATDLIYKANTRNKNDFKFANSLNADLKTMYIHNFKKLTVAPSVGMRIETAGTDMQGGEPYSLDTGGDVYFATAGFEMYYKNVSLAVSYLQPVHLKLDGEQFKTTAALQAGVKYTFNKKVKTNSQTNNSSQNNKI